MGHKGFALPAALGLKRLHIGVVDGTHNIARLGAHPEQLFGAGVAFGTRELDHEVLGEQVITNVFVARVWVDEDVREGRRGVGDVGRSRTLVEDGPNQRVGQGRRGVLIVCGLFVNARIGAALSRVDRRLIGLVVDEEDRHTGESSIQLAQPLVDALQNRGDLLRDNQHGAGRREPVGHRRFVEVFGFVGERDPVDADIHQLAIQASLRLVAQRVMDTRQDNDEPVADVGGTGSYCGEVRSLAGLNVPDDEPAALEGGAPDRSCLRDNAKRLLRHGRDLVVLPLRLALKERFVPRPVRPRRPVGPELELGLKGEGLRWLALHQSSPDSSFGTPTVSSTRRNSERAALASPSLSMARTSATNSGTWGVISTCSPPNPVLRSQGTLPATTITISPSTSPCAQLASSPSELVSLPSWPRQPRK